MKINIKNIAFVAGLFLLGACSNDNENMNPNNEVTFHTHISDLDLTSRSITTADFKTTFEEGDKIGIYATTTGSLASSGNYAENVEYVRQNDGSWKASGTAIQYPRSGTISFYAYYPYNETNSDPTAIAFSVKDDQNADTKETSDFMTAVKVDGSNTGKSVTLTFGHKMALVQLMVQKGTDDIDFSKLTSASIVNIIKNGTVNLGDGSPTGGSTRGSVKMQPRGDDATGKTFWAYIPVQSVAVDATLFKVVYDGTEYEYNLSGEVAVFEEGVLKSFALKIKGSGSLITSPVSLSDNTQNWAPSKDNDESEDNLSLSTY